MKNMQIKDNCYHARIVTWLRKVRTNEPFMGE
jgi:hypothetical protein